MNDRIIRAVAFAAAACLSLSSCSDTKKNNGIMDKSGVNSARESVPQSAAELLADSYKLTDYKVLGGFDNLGTIVPQKDGGYILTAYNYSDDSEMLYRADAGLSELREIKLDIPDEAKAADDHYCWTSISPEGQYAAIYMLYDDSGVKLPDGYDESFDYESFYESRKTSYGICFYNEDGSVRSFSMLSNIDEYLCDGEEERYLGSFIISSDDTLLLTIGRNEIFSCSSNGSLEKLSSFCDECETEDAYFMYASNGSVLLTYSYYPDADYSRSVRKIAVYDPERRTVEEPFFTQEDNSFAMYRDNFTTGYGDYLLLSCDDTDLYGIKKDGTKEQILNWSDADASPMSIVSAGNDEFYCWDIGNGGSQVSIYKLVKRDPAEAANTKIITVGVLYGWNEDTLNKYNRSQDKYRIKVINYSDKYEEENAGKLEEPQNGLEWNKRSADILRYMQLDIISGNAPDVILTDYMSTIELLGSKGFLADLYSYMDSDSEFSRDTIVPNILSAIESKDGHLYAITPDFSVDTIAVKKKYLDHENWTVKEMMDIYDSVEAEHKYDGNTKDEMLEMFLEGQSGIVDFENGKCHFDEPDFIELLKFCGRFVDKLDMPSKEDDPYGHQMYYTDKAYWLANDKDIISRASGYSAQLKYEEFGGDDVIMAGYPSSDGKGGRLRLNEIFAINGKSEVRDGAWEFVKFVLRSRNISYDEENSWHNSGYGLPILKKSFEIAMDHSMTLQDYNKELELEDVPSIQSKLGFTIFPLTKEERDECERYVLSCDTLVSTMDYDVKQVCFEEADAFFAGEKTAEEAAKMMQDRISTIVGERS